MRPSSLIRGGVVALGLLALPAARILGKTPAGHVLPLVRQASFSLPASSPTLRIAGLEYTGASTRALLVSIKDEAPYAEIVTTDASGVLQSRVVLNPAPRRVAGFGMRSDGGIAIADSRGSVSIYGPLGTPEAPPPMPTKVMYAQFIGGKLTGLTSSGLIVLDQSGAVQSLVPPYELTWPLALAAGPMDGEAAVIELGRPAVNVVTLSTGSWRRVVLNAPGLEETRTQDGVTPAVFSVAFGKDNGRIYAAANGVEQGILRVLEFNRTLGLRRRYACPLPPSVGDPRTYAAPWGIDTAGGTLLTYSAQERQIAIYGLPGQ